MLRSGIEPKELSDIGKGFISLKGNVLEVNSHSENITVNVYSFDGNRYISENITDARTVSISTLPSGFYYARASFPDGSSSSLKFIKRKWTCRGGGFSRNYANYLLAPKIELNFISEVLSPC